MRRVFVAILLCLGAMLPAAAQNSDDLLIAIRQRFHAGSPPPFVTYTLVRKQWTSEHFPDFDWSYTYHIWYRSSDGSALARKIFDGKTVGRLEFLHPLFNEAVDPGPPTADLFELARPANKTGARFPDSTLPVIGSVQAIGEIDYRISAQKREGALLHLWLQARRDPQRNRLREVWVQADTLDLVRAIAKDTLFSGIYTFPLQFTMNFGTASDRRVITDIHGVVEDPNFPDPEDEIDYTFRDIAFPQSLPEWYFEPSGYGTHVAEAPT